MWQVSHGAEPHCAWPERKHSRERHIDLLKCLQLHGESPWGTQIVRIHTADILTVGEINDRLASLPAPDRNRRVHDSDARITCRSRDTTCRIVTAVVPDDQFCVWRQGPQCC